MALNNETFLKAVQNVYQMAHNGHYKYGNSTTLPPCSDHRISCDRIVARALWDMGFHDQPRGGITCGQVDKWLPAHGFTKVTNQKDIKPGAVVAYRNNGHSWIAHVFVVVSYDHKTKRCVKFDTGSDTRIQTKQPYQNVPLNQWGRWRTFYAAYNPPQVNSNPKPVAKKEIKLNESQKWVGECIADELNVRSWAGKEYANIHSWPILRHGNRVGICDSLKAKDGSTWYYIVISNNQLKKPIHGFVSAKYIRRV